MYWLLSKIQNYGLENTLIDMEKKKFEDLMKKVLKEDKELLNRLANR